MPTVYGLTEQTAARLKLLLGDQGGAAAPAGRGSRGRTVTLVRCTSATPVGEIEDSAGEVSYPAQIVHGPGDCTELTDIRDCYLTVWDAAGVPGTPVEDGMYLAVLSGDYSPTDGAAEEDDYRPRAFAVAGSDGVGISEIEVEDVDQSPTVSGVTQLRFDSTDGFTVSTPGAGVARVDMAQATRTQNGIVTTGNQDFAGDKYFDEVGIGTQASPDGFLTQIGDGIGLFYDVQNNLTVDSSGLSWAGTPGINQFSAGSVLGISVFGGLVVGQTVSTNGLPVPILANSSADVGTVYYSTDASKLVFKDYGGTVHNLY